MKNWLQALLERFRHSFQFQHHRRFRMPNRRRDRTATGASRREGVAAVELAVLLPLLILLFVIAVDVGRIFHFSLTIQNCARAGAAYASDPHVAHESPFSTVEEAAQADAPNLSPPPKITTQIGLDAAGRSYVEVTAAHTFSSISHFPGIPHQIDLARTVRMSLAAIKPDVN